MQHFVNGGVFLTFLDEPTRYQVRGYHPLEIFKIIRVAIAVEKLPPPEKNATRRRVDESVE